MAYQVGGLEGINKAIECNNIATCEYSSGLQVSGTFTEVLTASEECANRPRALPIYLRPRDRLRSRFKIRNWLGTERIGTQKDLARQLVAGEMFMPHPKIF